LASPEVSSSKESNQKRTPSLFISKPRFEYLPKKIVHDGHKKSNSGVAILTTAVHRRKVIHRTTAKDCKNAINGAMEVQVLAARRNLTSISNSYQNKKKMRSLGKDPRFEGSLDSLTHVDTSACNLGQFHSSYHTIGKISANNRIPNDLTSIIDDLCFPLNQCLATNSKNIEGVAGQEKETEDKVMITPVPVGEHKKKKVFPKERYIQCHPNPTISDEL